MVILDRVVCNFCYELIGQLFSRSAEYSAGLDCLTLAPHFTACPDCLDSVQPVFQVAETLYLSESIK